jgi:predicted ferric reductase
VVTVSPLLVAQLGQVKPGQGLVVDFSVALGFVALAIMVLQFGLVARFSRVSAPFGMDSLIQYHRQIGYVALLFALVHPILLFVDEPSKLALLNLPHAPNRARFASASVLSLLLLIASSVWRKTLKLSYELWQLLHGLLAIAVVGFALAHAAGVGYYSANRWQRALWLLMAAGIVGDMIWVRLLKPLRHLRRPWEVRDVIAERGDACTLVLAPVGHPGLRFEPGQFAWLMVEQNPFSLSQHPFSFSSSAEATPEVAFTIKARGDFTSSMKDVVKGARAYVDGPHGVFSSDQNEGFGFVFIAGGVGITPLMSMLRTMADREDRRPCLLFYGSHDWQSVTFREQLEELGQRLHLTLVHVLESPHDGWEGERGFIDVALLKRHLPKHFARYRYFACGPPAMMDAVEDALPQLGVPDEHIVTERFDMV